MTGKKIISFSLFGTEAMYQMGAIENVRLAKLIYPEWQCWFYVGKSVSTHVVNQLVSEGANIVFMDRLEEDWSATMWRYYALGIHEAAVIFRDCDSRLSFREKCAVEEWLVSDRQFHVMRDHPEHSALVMAGMWGAKAPGMQQIRKLIPNPLPRSDRYHDHADQGWLAGTVYPVVRESLMSHCSFWSYEPDSLWFPTKRLPGVFVGQGYEADGSLRIPGDANVV